MTEAELRRELDDARREIVALLDEHAGLRASLDRAEGTIAGLRWVIRQARRGLALPPLDAAEDEDAPTRH